MESNQNNLHFHFYILIYKLHLIIYKHSFSVSSRAETNTKPASYATQVFSLNPSYQDLSSFPGWRKWAGDRPSLERVRIGIMMMKVKVLVSHVWLFVTPWTVAYQAPLSMEFSRQEYWSGLWCPLPGDLPDLGIRPTSLKSPPVAGGFFTTIATWEAPKQTLPHNTDNVCQYI